MSMSFVCGRKAVAQFEAQRGHSVDNCRAIVDATDDDHVDVVRTVRLGGVHRRGTSANNDRIVVDLAKGGGDGARDVRERAKLVDHKGLARRRGRRRAAAATISRYRGSRSISASRSAANSRAATNSGLRRTSRVRPSRTLTKRPARSKSSSTRMMLLIGSPLKRESSRGNERPRAATRVRTSVRPCVPKIACLASCGTLFATICTVYNIIW